MHIEYLDDYNALCRRGADLIMVEIRKKKDLLLCAATGSSPEGVYTLLAREGERGPELFNRLRIIKLDEWLGLPSGSAGTCEAYLAGKLIIPLGIPEERYISFRSDAGDPQEECARIRSILELQGPIDLAVLGIGKNGHIGLNEPGENLEPFCHHVDLTEESRQHRMLEILETRPSTGITLGMREILSARMIILLVAGKDKTEAVRRLLSGRITTGCPASFLWLHQQVHCLMLRNEYSLY